MRVAAFATLLMSLLTVQAEAQTIAAPRISEGDDWIYQSTTENRTGWRQTRIETTVERAGATEIEINAKPVGSTMPPREQLVGADWSRSRNIDGRETVVNRPLSFPLSIGKSWVVDYVLEHPNRAHGSEHFHSVFKVIGWERIVVPAGSFRALRVEADGEWSAVLAPAASSITGTRLDDQGATTVMQTGRTLPATVGGRMYKAFWYVPEVKKWAKSTEEYYDSNGVRNARFTDELDSYKVSGEH